MDDEEEKTLPAIYAREKHIMTPARLMALKRAREAKLIKKILGAKTKPKEALTATMDFLDEKITF